MKVIEKVGGALLGAILVIALISGFRTGNGREAAAGLAQAGRAIGRGLGGFFAGLGDTAHTAGNLGVALVVGLVLFVLLLLVFPATRNGRSLAAAAITCLLLSLLLFQPSIGTSLQDAVR